MLRSPDGRLRRLLRIELAAAICCALHGDGATEPVKPFETTAYDFFCASVSIVGWLIHAAVGSLGGLGRRFPNRHGLAA
jgi:hypothetical protein